MGHPPYADDEIARQKSSDRTTVDISLSLPRFYTLQDDIDVRPNLCSRFTAPFSLANNLFTTCWILISPRPTIR